MEEPFGMRPREIAELTDAQIVGLYGRERDAKTGVPKPVGVQSRRKVVDPAAEKEQFISFLMELAGKTFEEAEAAWDKGRLKGV